MIRNRLTPKPVVAVFLAIACCLNLACEEQPVQQTQQAVKVHSVKLIVPPEARALFVSALERLNAQNIPLSNGHVLRATSTTFDDLSALEKIGTMENQTHLWVAPFTALAAGIKRPVQSDTSITDCSSLMSSKLGVIYRSVDEFSLPAPGINPSLESLVFPSAESAQRAPYLIAGSPRFTSAGLMTALAVASLGGSTPLPNLTPAVIDRNISRIKATQGMVRNYYVSDTEPLEWLDNREGGEPLAVISTEQTLSAHKLYKSSSTLTFKPLSSPTAVIDYPLCSVVSKGDSVQDTEASIMVRKFLVGPEFRSLLTSAGFNPPLASSESAGAEVGATARELIKKWAELRRPSLTVFVVDASIKMDRSSLETIRREIKLFIDNRPSQSDAVAIIGASSNPETLSEPSTNVELLNIVLARLTTVGGNAIRDGIQTAFTLFSDLSTQNFRRSVVVFTADKDTSSQTSAAQLKNRASQLVGRKNVDLFVIGLGASEDNFGDLPATIRAVGGTFSLATAASLPSQFFPIARRAQ